MRVSKVNANVAAANVHGADCPVGYINKKVVAKNYNLGRKEAIALAKASGNSDIIFNWAKMYTAYTCAEYECAIFEMECPNATIEEKKQLRRIMADIHGIDKFYESEFIDAMEGFNYPV